MSKYNIGEYVIYKNKIHRVVCDKECIDCIAWELDGTYGRGIFNPTVPPHPNKCYKIRSKFTLMRDKIVDSSELRKAEPVEILTLLDGLEIIY